MDTDKKTDKKIYKKPEVIVHGDIETITQSGNTTPFTDVPKGSLVDLT